MGLLLCNAAMLYTPNPAEHATYMQCITAATLLHAFHQLEAELSINCMHSPQGPTCHALSNRHEATTQALCRSRASHLYQVQQHNHKALLNQVELLGQLPQQH